MNLREQVLSGIFWTGGVRLLSQIVSWAVTILVIRVLSPSDYGLLAMATVFMNMLAMAAEAGLGPALIQARELDDIKLRRSFGVVILINCALFAVQFASATLVAKFFDEERLVAILRVLAVQFLVNIFTLIPGALLARRLAFKTTSIVSLGGAMCASFSALGMALSGYGVWALVFGNLIGAMCTAVGINLVAPFLKRPYFSFVGMRNLVAFGGKVTVARALYFCYSQADVLIAGRLLGKELLGFYSVSLHLASLPVQKISSIVNTVAFPAFAEAQKRPDAIPGYVLKAIRMLSVFSFPVLWGISSIAPEIVSVLLGPRWDAAILPLQLLPLVMPISMLSPFLNTAFQAIGKVGVVLRNATTATLILPFAFWIGAHWGLIGLCVAWVVGYPLVFLLNLWRMLPLVNLKLSKVIGAAALPALGAGSMYASVAMVRYIAGDSLRPSVLMAVLIGSGIIAFAIITLLTNRKAVREIVDLLKVRRAGSDDVSSGALK